MSCALVAVDFKEFHPETYKGVVIISGPDDIRTGRENRFFSNDPVRDMAAARKWLKDEGFGNRFTCLSSVHDFQSDSGIQLT